MKEYFVAVIVYYLIYIFNKKEVKDTNKNVYFIMLSVVMNFYDIYLFYIGNYLIATLIALFEKQWMI